jgi:GntR family transcriptional regulator, rspAB operon transcriptional repressor
MHLQVLAKTSIRTTHGDVCLMAGIELGGIDAAPISRRTHDALAQAIVSGKLPPKTPLSDRRLAEQFGVSRTPVRDALHLLEASGLVQRRGRVGWVVTEFGVHQVRELYQLRRILESAGVADLASWTDDEVAVFDRFRDLQVPTSPDDDLTGYLAADRELHRQLVMSSKNALLMQFYEVVDLQIDRIRHFVPRRDEFRIPQSFEEHLRILDALRQRDAAAATVAIHAHISAAEEAMVGLL